MFAHTQSYARYKKQSQEMLDFAVVVCYAIPSLKMQAKVVKQGLVGTNLPRPDYFKENNSIDDVLNKAAKYKPELSSYIIISGFSFFEAYVGDAIQEMLNFHGGISRIETRIQSSMKSNDPKLIKHKRKLQDSIKTQKLLKYTESSKALIELGYQFPKDLLSYYAVISLKRRLDNLKASEIPDLLKESLLMNLNEETTNRFHDIRNRRNNIAHGKRLNLGLGEALKMVKDLHSLASLIDQHLVEHYFVIQDYI